MVHRLTGAAKSCTVNGVAPSHISLGSSVASMDILTAREGSCLRLLSLRDALPLPDLVLRVSARRHPWGWAHYSLDLGSWNPGSYGDPHPPPPTPGSLSRRASLLWASFGWSDFPGFLEGYSCLGLRAGLDFGLLAGWGLFFRTL